MIRPRLRRCADTGPATVANGWEALGLPLCYVQMRPGISKEDAPWRGRGETTNRNSERTAPSRAWRARAVMGSSSSAQSLDGKRPEFIVQPVNAVGESSDGGKAL
jgi:hypothetical protein